MFILCKFNKRSVRHFFYKQFFAFRSQASQELTNTLVAFKRASFNVTKSKKTATF